MTVQCLQTQFLSLNDVLMLWTMKCIFGHFFFFEFLNRFERMNYLGVVLNPAAAKLGTKLLLGCCGGMNDFVDLGFSVPGNSPTMIFPANDGLTFLPKSCCFFGGLVIPLMMNDFKICRNPKVRSYNDQWIAQFLL